MEAFRYFSTGFPSLFFPFFITLSSLLFCEEFIKKHVLFFDKVMVFMILLMDMQKLRLFD